MANLSPRSPATAGLDETRKDDIESELSALALKVAEFERTSLLQIREIGRIVANITGKIGYGGRGIAIASEYLQQRGYNWSENTLYRYMRLYLEYTHQEITRYVRLRGPAGNTATEKLLGALRRFPTEKRLQVVPLAIEHNLSAEDAKAIAAGKETIESIQAERPSRRSKRKEDPRKIKAEAAQPLNEPREMDIVAEELYRHVEAAKLTMQNISNECSRPLSPEEATSVATALKYVNQSAEEVRQLHSIVDSLLPKQEPRAPAAPKIPPPVAKLPEDGALTKPQPDPGKSRT